GDLEDQCLALLGGQPTAAVEWVKKRFVAILHSLGHEMAGQADTDDVLTRPLSYRYRNRRQQDWQAGPSIQHFIQVTIARLVIRLRVAAKAEIVEQIATKACHAPIQGTAQVRLRFVGHPGELA